MRWASTACTRPKDGRNIRIRSASRRDVNSAVKLWQALADERKYMATEHVSPEQKRRWIRSLGNPETLWALAEIDGKLVGSLTLARYGHLEKTKHVRELGMGVAKAFRGLGVGTALMDHAVRWADKTRVKKISLSVFSTNKKAIRLYEKFGFVSEGKRRMQFLIDGRYVDEIMMGRLY